MKELGTNSVKLELKNINKIYCFGTSFTAGGGYYFGSSDMETHYSEYYSSLDEYPKTMFNYSYPGQLKKLLNPNIEIKNFGKCGYGNDRTSRLIFEIVENLQQYTNDILFLIEFSYLGREEIYSKLLKSFIIHNYSINDDLSYGETTLAINHKYDSGGVERSLNSLNKIVKEYNTQFWDYENEHVSNNRNAIFLINYLLRNKINFLIVEGTHYNVVDELIGTSHLVEFSPSVNDNDRYSMNHFIQDHGLKISDVTNGKIEDYHSSLEGNKLIASKIYKHITKHYTFE